MAGVSVPIKLIKNEVSQDTDGNWSGPTETKYDLFAEIMEAGHGFRTYDAQTQLGMVRRFRIKLRFDLHPTGDWKIEFRGNKWTIIGVPEQDQEKLFHWIITANHK